MSSLVSRLKLLASSPAEEQTLALSRLKESSDWDIQELVEFLTSTPTKYRGEEKQVLMPTSARFLLAELLRRSGDAELFLQTLAHVNVREILDAERDGALIKEFTQFLGIFDARSAWGQMGLVLFVLAVTNLQVERDLAEAEIEDRGQSDNVYDLEQWVPFLLERVRLPQRSYPFHLRGLLLEIMKGDRSWVDSENFNETLKLLHHLTHSL